MIKWFKNLMKRNPKVPETLSDCFDLINTFEDGNIAKEFLIINEDNVASYHHSLGRWIRNNWGLWERKGELHKWFCGIGITHPDDMSGIILTSYWRMLHQKPIRLEEQIEHYKRYWSKNGPR